MRCLCDDELCRIDELRNVEAGSRTPIVGPAEGGSRDIADVNGKPPSPIAFRQSGGCRIWEGIGARAGALSVDLIIYPEAKSNHEQYHTSQNQSHNRSLLLKSHRSRSRARSRVTDNHNTLLIGMKRSSRVRF